MKKSKNFLAAICMGMMILTGITGCTKETEASQKTQIETMNVSDSPSTQEETPNKADSAVTPENTDAKADDAADDTEKKQDSAAAKESPDTAPTDTGHSGETDGKTQKVKPAQEGTEHLPGKIQSVETDSMIVAQTTLMGEGEDAFSVTLVDEKDAKKITVKFTSDTKVEHWIIQGGGAGIDMREASLSDLKQGQGVEIEGYYDGEDFIAVRILIEEYC